MRASFWNKTVPNRTLALASTLLAVGIAGCTQPDIDRPGTWKPTGANEQNLRAMLVNPADLDRAPGAITARGDSGARAVTRLLVDKRRPLLNVSVSRVGAAGDSQSDTPLSSGGSGGGAAQ